MTLLKASLIASGGSGVIAGFLLALSAPVWVYLVLIGLFLVVIAYG